MMPTACRPTPTSAATVALVGDTAYVGHTDFGAWLPAWASLRAVDVSDPTRPVLGGATSEGWLDRCQGHPVIVSQMLLAACSGSVAAIDISTADAPRDLGDLNVGGPGVGAIASSGDRLVVVDDNPSFGWIWMYDVGNPREPAELWSMDLRELPWSPSPGAAALMGDRLAIGGDLMASPPGQTPDAGLGAVVTLDVSGSGPPTVVDAERTWGSPWRMELKPGRLSAASWAKNRHVAESENLATVMGGGIEAFALDDAGGLAPVGLYAEPWARVLWATVSDAGRIYALEWTAWPIDAEHRLWSIAPDVALGLVREAGPTPRSGASLDVEGAVLDWAAAGESLWLLVFGVDAPTGLQILTYAVPPEGEIRAMGTTDLERTDMGDTQHTIANAAGLLYVGRSDGLQVCGLEDGIPACPQPTRFEQLGPAGHHSDPVLSVAGHRAWLLLDEALAEIDVTDPERPVLDAVHEVEFSAPPWSAAAPRNMVADAGRVFGLTQGGQVIAYDVSTPGSLREVGRVLLPFDAGVAGLVLDGDLPYAADFAGRAWALDVGGPGAPTLLAAHGVPDYVRALRAEATSWGTSRFQIAVADGRLLVPVSDGGLVAYRLEPPRR